MDDRVPAHCEHCPLRDHPASACPAHWHSPHYCAHAATGNPAWIDNILKRARVYVPRREEFKPTILPRSRDRVRVGLACPCLNQGGAEAWQLALARSVDPARISFVGLVVEDAGAIDGTVLGSFQALMPVGTGRTAMLALAASCDVLVTWAIQDLPGLVDGLPDPPKTVAVCHAPPESAWGQSVYASARPDRFVAVSELARDAIPAGSRPDAAVIWNAVDESRLGRSRSVATMRASWCVPDGAKVAGFYQRLAGEKDPMAAVRLAGAIPPGWEVVVVGDGDMKPLMVEAMDARGIGPDRLILAGSDMDAGSVLAAFDVMVCASQYESFGLSMAEAIHVGVPVVSTDVGLAKMVPGSTYLVPYEAPGEILFEACLRAVRHGPAPASVGLKDRLGSARFGAEWTEYLVGLMPAARPPNYLSRAVNLVGAVVEHGLDGFRSATPDVQDARKAVCLSCPHQANQAKACTVCGCGIAKALTYVGLDMDKKRAMASSRCPLPTPKWTAV